MTKPKAFYADDWVQLYHGDTLLLLPELHLDVDAVVTDPPRGETSLKWDRWPETWPTLLQEGSAGIMLTMLATTP